eukprot:gene4193-14296_t
MGPSDLFDPSNPDTQAIQLDKIPRTPHVHNLGSAARDELVLGSADATDLLSSPQITIGSTNMLSADGVCALDTLAYNKLPDAEQDRLLASTSILPPSSPTVEGDVESSSPPAERVEGINGGLFTSGESSNSPPGSPPATHPPPPGVPLAGGDVEPSSPSAERDDDMDGGLLTSGESSSTPPSGSLPTHRPHPISPLADGDVESRSPPASSPPVECFESWGAAEASSPRPKSWSGHRRRSALGFEMGDLDLQVMEVSSPRPQSWSGHRRTSALGFEMGDLDLQAMEV